MSFRKWPWFLMMFLLLLQLLFWRDQCFTSQRFLPVCWVRLHRRSLFSKLWNFSSGEYAGCSGGGRGGRGGIPEVSLDSSRPTWCLNSRRVTWCLPAAGGSLFLLVVQSAARVLAAVCLLLAEAFVHLWGHGGVWWRSDAACCQTPLHASSCFWQL